MIFIMENKKRSLIIILLATILFTSLPVLAGTLNGAECSTAFFKVMKPGLEAYAAVEDIINMDISSFRAQVSGIVSLVETLANSLLAIFITIEIISEIDRKADDYRWEDAVRLLLKLLVIKTVIDMSSDILAAMYASVGVLMNGLTSGNMGTSMESMIRDYADDLAAPLDGLTYTLISTDYMFAYIEAVIMKWILSISGVLVSVIAATRIFQIVMMDCFAPIPMAFCGWSELKDTTKRFLMSYFAICLHGAVILVIMRVFTVLMSSSAIGNLSGFSQILVCSIALLKSIMSSSNWAKEIIGAA